MQFCCKAFSNYIELAGERGLSFVAKRRNGRGVFCLQVRSLGNLLESDLVKFKLDEANAIFENGDSARVPVSCKLEFEFDYCLFCGTKFRELIDEDLSGMERLILKHDDYK